MPTLYSTGLPDLDDTLGGGVPPGTIVVLETPPASSGILTAAAFAAVPDRPTVYLTTDRTPDQIETDVTAALNVTHPAVGSDGDRDLSHLVITEFDDAIIETEIEEHAEPAGPADDTDANETDRNATAQTDHADVDGGRRTADEGDGNDHLPTIPDAVQAITRDATHQFGDEVGQSDDSAPFCLVFDALTPLLDASQERWTRTYRSLRTAIENLGGVALLVLPREPTRSLSAAERRIFHRADAVFRYGSDNRSDTDRLVIPRLSNASSECEELPVTVPLDVGAALKRNPDETFN